MSERINAACIQICSGPDIDNNLKAAGQLIREAAAKGAQLVSTPENTCHIRSPMSEKLKTTPWQKDHPGLPFFSDLAKELGIALHIGSMAVRASENKLYNRSFVFDAQGDLLATYDKIHLFDVQLPTGETHRESEIMQGGEKAVLVDALGVRIGLSICYDLRFSYLYRDLAKHGAQILMVPAAFTVPTGKAHWSVLNRARAIETGSFIIAAAQGGEHQGGRKTYGHSMIIAPWGDVLAEAPDDQPGIIMAQLDLDKVTQARNAIPALKHDRGYIMESE